MIEEIKNKRGRKKGHLVSEKTREKIGLGNKGKIISDDIRQKTSKTMKGIKKSDEMRKMDKIF